MCLTLFPCSWSVTSCVRVPCQADHTFEHRWRPLSGEYLGRVLAFNSFISHALFKMTSEDRCRTVRHLLACISRSLSLDQIGTRSGPDRDQIERSPERLLDEKGGFEDQLSYPKLKFGGRKVSFRCLLKSNGLKTCSYGSARCFAAIWHIPNHFLSIEVY